VTEPAERFTRLQKVAIFFLSIGEEKARQILADLDLETVRQISAAIADLGEVTAQEKAAVMIEFGDFFFKRKPLKSSPEPAATPPQGSAPPLPEQPQPAATGAKEEKVAFQALRHLRQRVDPGKIDWSLAGYDFGEGFKGPQGGRR
jgi:hypothetical protein